MSVMADMLGDMLKKALPPEVMAMLTEENLQSFKNNAEALVMELRSGIANVQAQNVNTAALLSNIIDHQAKMMEVLENGRSNGSGDGKRANANRGKSAGNGGSPD